MNESDHPGRWPVHMLKTSIPFLKNDSEVVHSVSQVKDAGNYILQLERERDELDKQNNQHCAEVVELVQMNTKLKEGRKTVGEWHDEATQQVLALKGEIEKLRAREVKLVAYTASRVLHDLGLTEQLSPFQQGKLKEVIAEFEEKEGK